MIYFHLLGVKQGMDFVDEVTAKPLGKAVKISL